MMNLDKVVCNCLGVTNRIIKEAVDAGASTLEEVQNATGYDHAGKYECSILMALYPDAVKKERLGDVKHWFAESAKDASFELGQEMVEKSLSWLNEKIK